MSTRPSFTVEYLEPAVVEAEPLPDEFSPSRLRRSLVLLAAVVLAVIAVLVLVPGLSSLREKFMGAQPGWLALAVVLQLGSCACLRARVPGRLLPAHELAHEHGDRAVRAGRQLGLLDRRCGRARARGMDPAPRRPPRRFHRPAHRGVLPADEPRERHVPRARRRGAGHGTAERLAGLAARPHSGRGRRAGDRACARCAPPGGVVRPAFDARASRRGGERPRRRPVRGGAAAADTRSGDPGGRLRATCSSTSRCSGSASPPSATTSCRSACCSSPTSSASSGA